MRVAIGLALLALVAAPVSANLLSPSDGDFEDPWTDGAPDWYSTVTSGTPERDSGIHGPVGANTGDHWGSVQAGGSNVQGSMYITIDTDGDMQLDLVIAGGSAGVAANLYVQLIDGDQNGAIIDSITSNVAAGSGFGWTPISLSGTAASGQVTIKAGYAAAGPDWSNGTAVHLDTIVLTPEPTSLGLLALAGLPLLRRRR